MAITVGGTAITFNDGTTQNTAAGAVIGSTWTNYSSSGRAWNTTYTNSTGKTIEVSVCGYASGVAGDKTITAYVNGSQIVINGSFGSTGTPYPSCCFLVPNGATYLVNTIGGNALTLSLWWELR